MVRNISGNDLGASAGETTHAIWPAIRRCALRAANWAVRRRLESELARHRRTAACLAAQIANDFEALDYVYRREELVSTKLRELHA